MNTNTAKKSLWGAFSIHDQASCARAIRNGGIAAMISAAITGAFGIAGFFMVSANEELSYLLDP